MSTPVLISRLHEALARYIKISPVSVTDLREALELIAELQSTLQELTADIAASRSTRKPKPTRRRLRWLSGSKRISNEGSANRCREIMPLMMRKAVSFLRGKQAANCRDFFVVTKPTDEEFRHNSDMKTNAISCLYAARKLPA
jgi:hypothetical protein